MILTSSHSFFFKCGTRRATPILAAGRIWPTKRKCILFNIMHCLRYDSCLRTRQHLQDYSTKQIHHPWMSSFTLHMAIEQPSHLSHLLHRNPQDATPGMNTLADFEPYPPANLMVDVTANPNRMPAALAKEAMKNPNFTAAVRQLRDSKDVRFKADSNGAQAAGQSRLVFIISSTVVSQKTCAAQAFRIPVDIYYAGRSSAASSCIFTTQSASC